MACRMLGCWAVWTAFCSLAGAQGLETWRLDEPARALWTRSANTCRAEGLARAWDWTWRNGDRRLLVFFVPRARTVVGCQYQAWKTQRAVQQWSPPYCLYQKQAGYMATPGARLRFDTILIPHGPAEDPAALAATIVAAGGGPRRSIRLNLGGQSIEAIVGQGRPELKDTAPP